MAKEGLGPNVAGIFGLLTLGPAVKAYDARQRCTGARKFKGGATPLNASSRGSTTRQHRLTTKRFRNLAGSQIIADSMDEMGLRLPPMHVDIAAIRRKYHVAQIKEGGGKRRTNEPAKVA